MFFSRSILSVTLAALLAVASAQDFQVTVPSSDHWWVAQSINSIAWTCSTAPAQTFTILIANTDVNILPQPQAIIAIENNFDCSKTITQDQANYAAGSGYTVLLADPLNNTHVYATSQPFEIKPLGSAYPPQTTDSSASSAASTGSQTSGSAAPTSSGSSSSSNTTTSDAMSLRVALGGMTAAAVAVAGLIMA
ncbi:hypothetical protein C8Q75DRAFT_718685 [Abortiporus biennis]|nr:hypothetical protein C8Q75DRAFT_718685 [Abortiporus biennis]